MNIQYVVLRHGLQCVAVWVLFSLALPVRGQTMMGAFHDELSGSRYARAMRMGDAYTGIAEGLEAVHYNTAGMALLRQPAGVFSIGQGTAFAVRSFAADAAAAVPFSAIGGVAGISHSWIRFLDGAWTTAITSLHYGRELTEDLSAGVDLHYLSYNSSLERRDAANRLLSTQSLNGHAVDASLSALFRCPLPLLGRESGFRAGVRLRNLFGSTLRVNDSLGERLFQTVRLGASCRIVPPLPALDSLVPLALIVSGDLSYSGREYSFKIRRPNFGIEISILEMLQLSYGRENESKLDDRVYGWSPQFPVNRHGAGVILPVYRLTGGSIPVELRVDYCKSNWQNIDERHPPFPFSADIDDEAWSVGVTLK